MLFRSVGKNVGSSVVVVCAEDGSRVVTVGSNVVVGPNVEVPRDDGEPDIEVTARVGIIVAADGSTVLGDAFGVFPIIIVPIPLPLLVPISPLVMPIPMVPLRCESIFTLYADCARFSKLDCFGFICWFIAVFLTFARYAISAIFSPRVVIVSKVGSNVEIGRAHV